MLSHGQTVHFKPHSVLHLRKAEHLRIPKFKLKVNFRHPMKRHIFGDTSGQTFYMTRDCVLYVQMVCDEKKSLTEGSKQPFICLDGV